MVSEGKKRPSLHGLKTANTEILLKLLLGAGSQQASRSQQCSHCGISSSVQMRVLVTKQKVKLTQSLLVSAFLLNSAVYTRLW